MEKKSIFRKKKKMDKKKIINEQVNYNHQLFIQIYYKLFDKK